jgi:hypothetical protein
VLTFSKFLAAFLVEKIKLKFLLASLKTLINSESPYLKSLQLAYCGFPKAAHH